MLFLDIKEEMVRTVSYILLLISMNCCSQSNEAEIETKIKSFYSYYISQIDSTFPNIEHNNDSLEKYCTTSLLKRWRNEKEYDILIQAQDYYIEWAKQQTISKEGTHEYLLCFEPQNHCILITVVKDDEEWKIDLVKATDSH